MFDNTEYVWTLTERLYAYRYTVTTRMTPALSWAAMRTILMFHELWRTVTRQCPQTTTFLKRKEMWSGIKPRPFCLPVFFTSRFSACPHLRKTATTTTATRPVYVWTKDFPSKRSVWCQPTIKHFIMGKSSVWGFTLILTVPLLSARSSAGPHLASVKKQLLLQIPVMLTWDRKTSR